MEDYSSYLARPWLKVKKELDAAKVQYTTEVSRPERDFFKINEEDQYVIRVRQNPEGVLEFVTAGRLFSKIG